MTANTSELGPEAKPTLYLETSVASYLVARPSRDVIVVGHQQITREWWETRRLAFRVLVSSLVVEEVSEGDADLARQRRALLQGFPILQTSSRIERLADQYYTELDLPERAARDAGHLAFAVVYQVDYLMTWNCRHIANAEVRRRLRSLNEKLGLWTPTICTPEELVDVRG